MNKRRRFRKLKREFIVLSVRVGKMERKIEMLKSRVSKVKVEIGQIYKSGKHKHKIQENQEGGF